MSAIHDKNLPLAVVHRCLFQERLLIRPMSFFSSKGPPLEFEQAEIFASARLGIANAKAIRNGASDGPATHEFRQGFRTEAQTDALPSANVGSRRMLI